MNWLKIFTLSLFSDTHAKASINRGFANILLTSVLAVLFLFLGIFAGKTLTFFAYYGGAEDFREFAYNAFIGSEKAAPITVKIKDGKADITSSGGDVLINTFVNESDKNVYEVNGYHFIADSRNVSSVYDDFEAYCVKNGTSEKISYEDYLKLNESEKQTYRFAVCYTGKQKQITDTDAAEYKNYLITLNDEAINSKLKELEDKKQELSAESYNGSVYELYVNSYYPDISYAIGERVPTLRGYYYGLTLKSEGKYFCLFGDMATASFESYSFGVISFGGLYNDDNGLIISDGDKNASAAVDKFIKNLYYGTLPMLFLMEMLSGIYAIVVIELIIAGCMLLCYALGKLKKKELCGTFGKCVKLVASYVHTGAFVSAVAAICLGFVLTGNLLAIVSYTVFAVILIVRTLVLVLRDGKRESAVSDDGADGAKGFRTDLI
ncbi:MAG: hypothetical protein K2L42_00145 [Clostridia bacterium]|nr:hypothetical protein [Clostridia bacterium]